MSSDMPEWLDWNADTGLPVYPITPGEAEWFLEIAGVETDDTWTPGDIESALRTHVGTPGEVNAIVEDIQRRALPL
jgi:hypothetical protein